MDVPSSLTEQKRLQKWTKKYTYNSSGALGCKVMCHKIPAAFKYWNRAIRPVHDWLPKYVEGITIGETGLLARWGHLP